MLLNISVSRPKKIFTYNKHPILSVLMDFSGGLWLKLKFCFSWIDNLVLVVVLLCSGHMDRCGHCHCLVSAVKLGESSNTHTLTIQDEQNYHLNLLL